MSEPNGQKHLSTSTSTTVPPSTHHTSMGTEYMKMLLKDVSMWHNILAIFFTWIVLAGFLFLPGSFGTLLKLQIHVKEYKDVLSAVQNLPLFVVGFSCSAIGVIGMCYLWWCHGTNYAWLVNSIFAPGLLSGVSGLISTFVDIYANKDGKYKASSIASVAVTGACAAICGLLVAIYSFWLLRRLKKDHDNAQKGDVGTRNDEGEGV